MSEIKHDPIPRLSYICYLPDGSTYHTKPALPTHLAASVREEIAELKWRGVLTSFESVMEKKKFSEWLDDNRERLSELKAQERQLHIDAAVEELKQLKARRERNKKRTDENGVSASALYQRERRVAILNGTWELRKKKPRASIEEIRQQRNEYQRERRRLQKEKAP